MLLLTFCLVYIYFNINEYFTMGYKIMGTEQGLVHGVFFGDYAMMFWVVQSMLIVIPVSLMIAVLAVKRLQRFTPPILALASLVVVIGFWAERYLIIIPTLAAPYLPNEKLPYDWLHYHPTWVEWSITAGATALFLLIYSLFAKLFPMISIWETRIDDGERELVEHRRKEDVKPGMATASQGLGSIPTASIILVALVLFGAGGARAARKGQAKGPEATTLALQWHEVAGPVTQVKQQSSTAGKSGVNGFFGHLFGWLPEESPNPVTFPPKMFVTASLLDAKGQPLAFQVIALSLKTSFGKLDYGNRATNSEGKAQFTLDGQRYGKYLVEATYADGEQFAAAQATSSVDFGRRPDPALSSEGMLTTPYATANIALPFVVFYGTMWVVFFYVGYLIIWRMRWYRAHQAQTKITDS